MGTILREFLARDFKTRGQAINTVAQTGQFAGGRIRETCRGIAVQQPIEHGACVIQWAKQLAADDAIENGNQNGKRKKGDG
jgi:hypothetical protein